MGRKPGKQDIPKEAAKKQVLELLTQGSTITDAMKAVGRNDVTFRQWSMSDPEFKAEADKSRLAGKGVKADMASDSWMSKNIRPLTLVFLLIAYSGFAIASIFEYETRGAYVELLGQWGMLVMSFYFGGRTMEKIADKVKK